MTAQSKGIEAEQPWSHTKVCEFPTAQQASQRPGGCIEGLREAVRYFNRGKVEGLEEIWKLELLKSLVKESMQEQISVQSGIQRQM